jgi:small GTP-binding protein
MGEPYSLKVKICIIGDSHVGKTSLIRRYVMDIFDDKYITTLGTKVSKKQIKIKKNNQEVDLTLSIWDVLGQEEFSKIQTMAFKGSRGAIVVCDITRNETLTHSHDWVKKIREVNGDIPIVLLANKADLTSNYAFDENELVQSSQHLKVPFYKTSAKFGDNVIKTFYTLGTLIASDIFKDLN